MTRRVLGAAAGLAVLVGAVVGGASAASAGEALHGPYKTKAACNAIRAEVAVHATVGDCFGWPKRGWFFSASS